MKQASVLRVIALIKEFALKPRRVVNTFWLWGVLYPWLFVIIFILLAWL